MDECVAFSAEPAEAVRQALHGRYKIPEAGFHAIRDMILSFPLMKVGIVASAITFSFLLLKRNY